MDSSDGSEALIKKEIIYNGSKYVPLIDGTKVCNLVARLKLPQMFTNFYIDFLGEIPLSN